MSRKPTLKGIYCNRPAGNLQTLCDYSPNVHGTSVHGTSVHGTTVCGSSYCGPDCGASDRSTIDRGMHA